MKIKQLNQQNPPSPKKRWMDSKGNIREKAAVKSGTSTTIIATGVTKNCFDVAWNNFVETIKAGGGRIAVTTVTFK